MIETNRTIFVLVTCIFPLMCAAQQGASGSKTPAVMPSPDQLEPGVNTSAPAPRAAAPVQGANSPKVAEKPQAASASPKAAAPGGPNSAGKAPAEKAAARKSGPDRLQLDATDITGNRELPKVLYIVPWKRADLGDLMGKPPNSLVDDVLQPVDRDVFRRENRYYDGLKSQAGGTPPAADSAPKNP
jgi:hypothetical protein